MCNSCEAMMSQAGWSPAPQDRGLDEYPPEWQEDFTKLTVTIVSLSERYPDQVKIHIWDPRSLQGMIKSIRHWVRHYPTFIVNGHNKYVGWDTVQMENCIQSTIESIQSAI